MLKVAPNLFGTDRRECRTQRFYQSFFCPSPNLAHKPLDLAERLFDRIEVRRVGWQVEKFTAVSLDQFPVAFRFVSREVVHHYDLPRSQSRCEHLLYVGLEDPGVVAPSTAKDGPIPQQLMLESRVVFLPRLRGTGSCKRSPVGE